MLILLIELKENGIELVNEPKKKPICVVEKRRRKLKKKLRSPHT